MEEEKKDVVVDEKMRRSTKSKITTVLLLIAFLCIIAIICWFLFFDKEEVEPKGKPNEEIKLVENKDYFIRGEYTGTYFKLTKRGYYIDTLDEPNAPYYYIICMGEKNTGGYSLEISEVKKVDGKVVIIVKENSPSPNDVVTQALTYPTITVEFPTQQENIVIKNTEGVEFPLLNEY